MLKKILKNKYWQDGEPFVWATGAALTLILVLTFALLFVIVKNGIAVYWPADLVHFEMEDGSAYLGEVVQTTDDEQAGIRHQVKIGNRDLYPLDFKWLTEAHIQQKTAPREAVLLERSAYGNFYGYLAGLELPSLEVPATDNPWARFKSALAALGPGLEELQDIQAELSTLNAQVERLDGKIAKLVYHDKEADPQMAALQRRKESLSQEFQAHVSRYEVRERDLMANTALFEDAGGRQQTIALMSVIRAYRPNDMSPVAKTGIYLRKVWELFTAEPRESNTEGGLFPAIFGTIMLIFIMSILSFPLGVLAGIYLREYAREGLLVRLVRIAVNNLAGIPSIVYGIFGLAFFVYGIGSSIDQLFFPEQLPTPTFGTGGILWASLTLGLLTVPVVIVATEEALGAIPSGLRESSFALGSTKLQTLTRILLPMASPGILTGFILAMARAAGEVAPLMITGVVKLAPALPLDATFPFLHLDRKFMHLGFHIYDIGFQSPNVEAAKPMVFVTTLLLLAIVITMTSSAIVLRSRMKKKFAITND